MRLEIFFGSVASNTRQQCRLAGRCLEEIAVEPNSTESIQVPKPMKSNLIIFSKNKYSIIHYNMIQYALQHCKQGSGSNMMQFFLAAL